MHYDVANRREFPIAIYHTFFTDVMARMVFNNREGKERRAERLSRKKRNDSETKISFWF
jgi:hypothetical protein